MSQNIKPLLLNNSLFAQLNSDQLDVLVRYLVPHPLKAGDLVFKEGSHGNYVCFVLEGRLEVIKQKDDDSTVIATLGEGESVGEMSIIDGLTRSASVRAKENCSLLLLKRDDFNRLFNDEPEIAAKILKAIARMLSLNLRRTSGELTNLLLA